MTDTFDRDREKLHESAELSSVQSSSYIGLGDMRKVSLRSSSSVKSIHDAFQARFDPGNLHFFLSLSI